MKLVFAHSQVCYNDMKICSGKLRLSVIVAPPTTFERSERQAERHKTRI